VLPGSYLAQAESDGVVPGADYVRIALVHDTDITREALKRVVATLS
jgi:N-succinyldiaminopimelate aminotransferase